MTLEIAYDDVFDLVFVDDSLNIFRITAQIKDINVVMSWRDVKLPNILLRI